MTERQLKDRSKSFALREAGELTTITVASRKTLRFGNPKSRIENPK